MVKHFTLKELEDMPTLCVGRGDNLKVDTGKVRVWLSRCGIEDGLPYDNMVTVEVLSKRGDWEEYERYPAE